MLSQRWLWIMKKNQSHILTGYTKKKQQHFIMRASFCVTMIQNNNLGIVTTTSETNYSFWCGKNKQKKSDCYKSKQKNIYKKPYS